MNTSPSSERRDLTEGVLAEYLGIERLEIFLLAAALKAGRYDSITHLLMLTEDEAAAIAGQLGMTWRRRS